MPTSVPNRVLRFGVFELDQWSGELRKHGVRIKLQEQPFQILALLLHHPGELVSREAIRNKLWPEDTFVDFDNAISSAVRKLREALGDSAENPRFIETVARHGYRFTASVSSKEEGPDVEAAQPGPLSSRQLDRARQLKWRKWVGLVGVGLATAALIVLIIERAPIPEPDLRATPLTSYPGSEREPSFSPDGSRISFFWDGPDRKHPAIYMKMMDSGNPVRVTDGVHHDSNPAWSPDGRTIAFIRRLNKDYGAIMLVSALGGQERELGRIKSPMPITDADLIPIPPYLSWSADGKYAFAVGLSNTNPRTFAIVRLSEAGELRQMTFPPSRPGGDSAAAISGDGSRLAFARTTSNAMADLFTVPLSRDSLPTQQPEQILSNVWIECLAWTSDNRDIVFSGSVNGKEGLWRVGIQGARKVRQLNGIGPNVPPSKLKTGYFGRGVDLAASRQGGYLVYSQTNSDWNIWRIGLRGAEKGKGKPFVSSTRDEVRATYSADGQKIAFESDRSGTEEIWVSNQDGSDAMQLTHFDKGWSGSPRFSPDGQLISFDRQESLKWAIYVIKAQGGTPVRISTNSANNARPSWSPDGRWIYFMSDRTGRFEVWKMPSTGRQELQVTKNGVGDALEAPDGSAIYYMRHEGSAASLWKCSNDGTQESRILDSVCVFALAKHGIYFLPCRNAYVSFQVLEFLDFATHRRTTLFSTPSYRVGGHLSVSPDERWVLYEQQDGTDSDLLLVKNFR